MVYLGIFLFFLGLVGILPWVYTTKEFTAYFGNPYSFSRLARMTLVGGSVICFLVAVITGTWVIVNGFWGGIQLMPVMVFILSGWLVGSGVSGLIFWILKKI